MTSPIRERSVTARQFPRVRVALPVTVSLAEDERLWSGTTANLSLRGLRALFEGDEPKIPSGSVVAIALEFPSGTATTLPARVVSIARTETGWSLAVEFLHPDSTLRAFVRMHVAARTRQASGEHQRAK